MNSKPFASAILLAVPLTFFGMPKSAAYSLQKAGAPSIMPGCEPCGNMPQAGTFEVFEKDQFGASLGKWSILDKRYPPNQVHRFPDGINDRISSAKWNLPAGVIVVFYEHELQHLQSQDYKQVAVWRGGCASRMAKFRLNDEVSGWAWFRP